MQIEIVDRSGNSVIFPAYLLEDAARRRGKEGMDTKIEIVGLAEEEEKEEIIVPKIEITEPKIEISDLSDSHESSAFKQPEVQSLIKILKMLKMPYILTII